MSTGILIESNLAEQFQKAQAESMTLKKRPNNPTLLRLYSLYKQANLGDAPPYGPDDDESFVAVAKFRTWAGLRGTAQEAAMQQYVELVAELKGKE